MKKLLFAGMLLLSVAAIHASNNGGKNAYALYGQDVMANIANRNFINDTVPKDTTDTTHKPQFYGSAVWNSITDTVPKDTSDTTHKPQL